jgi:peptide/nickel transport system substrate-binding protein
MRQAVNFALNRKLINEAACLGFCPPRGVIVPRVMDFALQVEPPPYDPARAKKLLAEAGYPNGFDAGDLVPIPPFFTTAESVVNDLNAVGIRVKMRPTERATFYANWREKKLRGIFITAAGNSGNAASRVESFISSKGQYAYGGYPDIDDLFPAAERASGTRASARRSCSASSSSRSIASCTRRSWICGRCSASAPKIADSAMNIVPLTAFPSYEDIKLKGQ